MIRILGPADWEDYRNLRLEALATNPEAFGSSWEEERNRPSEQWQRRLEPQPGLFMLGAFTGDSLVGMVGLRREDRAKTRHKGIVFSMYVTPDARKGGVGRALLERLLALAGDQEGLELLQLTVVSENTAAVRLYESLGFRTFGEEPRALKIGDRYLDERHMTRML